MIGCLWLCAALAMAVEDEARSLVGRLGAERFDDRVAAIKALERLGPSALPALREAADSRDPRIRSRARDVLESLARRAEAERFSRPTTIRLDFRDQTLGAVIDALNARDDLDLALTTGPPMAGRFGFNMPGRPDPLTTLKERRVTLEADAPVPFWDAIDRLCAAVSLRYDVTPRARFGVTQGSLVLMGDRTRRSPVSDFGPFRVQMTRVHAAAERDFAGAPDQAGGGLTVSLAVLVEPGLSVQQAGPIEVDDAVDDRGRPLPRAADRNPGATAPFAQTAGHGSFPAELMLAEPDPPPRTIRRLRGKVPVVVTAREADPMIVPLNRAGATPATVHSRDFHFTVDTGPGNGKGGAVVTITARPVNGVATRAGGPNFRALNFGSRGGYDRGQQHFELFDAAGRRLKHGLASQSRGADRLGFYDRYQLSVGLPGPARPAGAEAPKAPVAAELRFYEFVQKEFHVPFDFHDLPLP